MIKLDGQSSQRGDPGWKATQRLANGDPRWKASQHLANVNPGWKAHSTPS
jgi:hypothetical protein